jgi:hypothetical protein
MFFLLAQPNYAREMRTLETQAKHKTYNRYNSPLSFVEFIEAAKWCKVNLPDTARIASRKPEIFYMMSDGLKCDGVPFYATPEEVLKNFEDNEIDYVVIDWWFPHAYRTIVPAIQKYPDRFKAQYQVGGENNQPVTYVFEIIPQ